MRSKLKILVVTVVFFVGLMWVYNNKQNITVDKEVIYVKGMILSNNIIEGENKYLNRIELESGEIFEEISYRQILYTNSLQKISMGNFYGSEVISILEIDPI